MTCVESPATTEYAVVANRQNAYSNKLNCHRILGAWPPVAVKWRGADSQSPGATLQHQKAPEVLFQDAPHRFCHQCAKLHPLSQFKGMQRNCLDSLAAKRLKSHQLQTRVEQQIKVGRSRNTPLL
jgi:hypothetical protein